MKSKHPIYKSDKAIKMAILCDICCESINNKRKQLECPYCNKESCIDCVKRFVLGTLQDPYCMFCNHAWTEDFVDTMMDNTFKTKQLQKHREAVLYEREKSLMPATQPAVELRIAKIKYEEKRKELIERKRQIEQELTMLQEDFNVRRTGQAPIIREMVRTCPANGCRGFLDNKWACGMCNVQVCKDCEEIIPTGSEDHECDPDTVKTVQLLRKDCKKCPKCPALIHKIDGCSQMFCVKCHCVFDYRTGVVQAAGGHVHNPEYYRWLRDNNNGQVPFREEDVVANQACNGRNRLVSAHTLFNTLTKMNIRSTSKEAVNLSGIHRLVNHMIHIDMQNMEQFNLVRAHEELRIQFMMNEITEDEFKIHLQRKEKAAKKKRAFLQLFELITTVITEAFTTFIKKPDIKTINDTVLKIAEYGLAEFDKIDMRFGSKNAMLRQSVSKLIDYAKSE